MKVFVFWEQVKNLREGRTMKRIMIALIIIFSFSGISVVAAGDFPGKHGNWPVKESPESSVTCINDFVLSRSTSTAVNVEQCNLYPNQDQCASCITSLEDQGCKFVDFFVSHPQRSDGTPDSEITYLLSCDGR